MGKRDLYRNCSAGYRRLRRLAPVACLLGFLAGVALLTCACSGSEPEPADSACVAPGGPAATAASAEITVWHTPNGKTRKTQTYCVPGLKIEQKKPDSAELEALLASDPPPETGIRYQAKLRDFIEKFNGRSSFDRCILTCYVAGKPLWHTEFTDFAVRGQMFTPDGTFVWGDDALARQDFSCDSYLALVDHTGQILWQRRLEHGFEEEFIQTALYHGDGTWTVISQGDLNHLCLSRHDLNGHELSCHEIELEDAFPSLAAPLGDGYLVQFYNYDLPDRLAMLERDGAITDILTYSAPDYEYFFRDIAVFGGKIYLSLYVAPLHPTEGYRRELKDVLQYAYDGATDEELAQHMQDNFSALLLVCRASDGAPLKFYSVDASMGGNLSINSAGALEWNVESLVTAQFYPQVSAFSISSASQVFCYTFDRDGTLLQQENTGRLAYFHK